MKKKKLQGRSVLGIILVLIGITMIARSLNIFSVEFADDLFSWPMILVVLGIIFLSSKSNNTTGWILLIVGAIFLLPRITGLPYSLREVFWPVVFIGIGLLILFKSLGSFRRRGTPETSGSSMDFIDEVAILGGNERKINSKSFKGGQITSILGGSQIYLLDARLAPGENVIELFTLFGGSTLIVPNHWNVKVEVTSIFGGFSDKRSLIESREKEDEGLLIIKGIALFGGGELKNF
ncbi:MAG: LiaF transmembrane domain-containing protein [Bacteroidota bacterium]